MDRIQDNDLSTEMKSSVKLWWTHCYQFLMFNFWQCFAIKWLCGLAMCVNVIGDQELIRQGLQCDLDTQLPGGILSGLRPN